MIQLMVLALGARERAEIEKATVHRMDTDYILSWYTRTSIVNDLAVLVEADAVAPERGHRPITPDASV